MTPLFRALSMARYKLGRTFSASGLFFLRIRSLISFSADFKALFFLRLKTAFLASLLKDFFAAFINGIRGNTIKSFFKKQILSRREILGYYKRVIAKLTGKIEEIKGNALLLGVENVGYKIFVSTNSLAKLRQGEELSIWTHLIVRENVLDLYGFTDKEEREFFELLITVSGIGPKSALAILSLAPAETLRKAIVSEDAVYLTKVSGIGKKSAQKIVLELKDKLSGTESDDAFNLREESDTIEALKALGYTLKEAREALKNVPPEAKNPNERIRLALKNLGSNA